MPDAADQDDKSKTPLIDLLSALILSIAALLTTFASYQAELWDGEQAAHYTEAGALRVEASKASLRGGQVQGADLMSFGAWLNARAAGELRLEDFYRARFRPEFRTVFESWLATDPLHNPNAPPTPFAMSAYELAEHTEADALERRAQDMFEAGEDANARGDKFVLATVILANALFFGGIGQVFRSRFTRITLVGVSLMFCVLGAIRILTLPPAPM